MASRADGRGVSFFLLVERGPTTFDVRAADEPPTFCARVTVGAEHACSACRWREQPCRHTRWVLQKLFAVPRESALMARTGLSERELGALVSARPRQQAPRADRVVPRDARGGGAPAALRAESVEWLLALSGEEAALLLSGPAARAPLGAPLAASRPRRRPLDPDECCAICFERMGDDPVEAAQTGDELVWCKVSCGRSTHARCLAAWATHNVQPGLAASCPLCRAAWPVGQAASRADAAERDEAAEHERRARLLDGLGELAAREVGAREVGARSDDDDGVDPPSSAALRWFHRQQLGERLQLRADADGARAPGARGACTDGAGARAAGAPLVFARAAPARAHSRLAERVRRPAELAPALEFAPAAVGAQRAQPLGASPPGARYRPLVARPGAHARAGGSGDGAAAAAVSTALGAALPAHAAAGGAALPRPRGGGLPLRFHRAPGFGAVALAADNGAAAPTARQSVQ
ncbi:hypothetical protein KFE25_013020 [Diacronema lutheri]|uniref:RING-type domain-containing protein n=1 Tax=Diacronema lutheri TaxID=2081491 RepID=A0A8J6C3K0_DIALT|nr:hypothetical protein KFE25_013020 [Diacronema lutheri]